MTAPSYVLCIHAAREIPALTKFIISDFFGNGICCGDGDGHYKVTTSNGALIAEGGEFGREESTRFSLPFVSAPSDSPSPSQPPSVSFSPSEKCFWIEIGVIYDNYADESYWELQRVDINGYTLLVESYSATCGDTSITIPMCLQEGEYEFTIRDSANDGICCSCGYGHYKVTVEDNFWSFCVPDVSGAVSSSL